MQGQVLRPWVFKLYQSYDALRFFVIPDRKATTLLTIILEQAKEGYVIGSEEWAAFPRISEFRYIHFTVCHKGHYVDLEAGF